MISFAHIGCLPLKKKNSRPMKKQDLGRITENRNRLPGAAGISEWMGLITYLIDVKITINNIF